MLGDREKSEETKFIRTIEAAQQAEIRANIERILALDDSNAEKKELHELLADKKEDGGIISKLGLDDWKFALPFGLFIAIPAITNEVLIIDAETQLTAVFILFCATMYTQVGGMVAKSLDDYGKDVYEELKAVDNVMLEQLNSAIAADQMALSLEEDFKEYCALTDQLAVVQADVLNHKEVHVYREAIVKKLDSLYALEESATHAIKLRMTTKVKADVIHAFATDKKVKEAALNRAIEVLSNGAQGPMGKDVVGEVFTQSLAAYRTAYAKMGADPILVQLEKDMAAVAVAPVVEGKGGNVFVTNPIIV